jgi:nucleoside-diphosphate-sugar epimerase
MGDPDQPHSYSYTPDVASSLAVLGTADGATGKVWHLPVTETKTTRELVASVYAAVGRRPRLLAAGALTLRALGLFKPAMREYLHTLYQFNDPWVVDDAKFRRAFGDRTTPLGEALVTTLDWYRARSAASAH